MTREECKEDTLTRLVVTSKIKGWGNDLISAFTKTFESKPDWEWRLYVKYWEQSLDRLDPRQYPDSPRKELTHEPL